MSFYDLEDAKDAKKASRAGQAELIGLSEEELDKECKERYGAFIDAVQDLDFALSKSNGEEAYDIKVVVDALKESGETLTTKEKETFIKNVKAGRVKSSHTIFFKDFAKKDAVDVAYKLYFLSWKIISWQEAKDVKQMERKDYYSIFGEDYI